MSSRAEILHERIHHALTPSHLEILDESHKHSRGEQSHFRVVVVAEAFAGLGLLARHKAVYAAVGEELRAGLHALAITAKSPAEWQAKPEAGVSPPCASGRER